MTSGRSGPIGAWRRWADRLAALTAVIATLSLLIRTTANNLSVRFGSPHRAYVVYAAVFCAAAVLVAATNRWPRLVWLARAAVWPVAIIVVDRVFGPQRALTLSCTLLLLLILHVWRHRARSRWIETLPGLLIVVGSIIPIRHVTSPREDNPANGVPTEALAPDDRARWALRLALHRLTAGDSAAGLDIPAEWPFPDDAELAVVDRGDSSRVVLARLVGADRACKETLGSTRRARGFTSDWLECRTLTAGERPLPFTRPRRSSWMAAPPSGRMHAPWPQYRLDAEKSATAAGPSDTLAWSTLLEAGARASVSVSGGLAIIGTHGGGSLEAFQLTNGMARWRVRLPNWVHQDAVSDGRTVVVGFGDNGPGKYGNAPSGVSAYDLQTGRLIWTAFEATSVMTSPVIRGGEASYVTFEGVLRIRDLSTGAVRATLSLPGEAIMAPPAIRGDTMFASLEPNLVCAVALAVARTIWCTRVENVGWLGRAGPGLAGETLIVSGPSVGRPDFRRWKLATMLNVDTLELAAVFPWFGRGGHRVVALDVRTGRELWRSDIVPISRYVTGHSSGTPVFGDQVIVVNLPFADRVVAFDRRDHRLLWSVDAAGSRGPVLILNSRVYLATGGGTIRVDDERTGRPLCGVKVPRRFDRIGPTAAGTLLLFPSVQGDLVAIPRLFFDRCDVARIGEAFTPW